MVALVHGDECNLVAMIVEVVDEGQSPYLRCVLCLGFLRFAASLELRELILPDMEPCRIRHEILWRDFSR